MLGVGNRFRSRRTTVGDGESPVVVVLWSRNRSLGIVVRHGLLNQSQNLAAPQRTGNAHLLRSLEQRLPPRVRLPRTLLRRRRRSAHERRVVRVDVRCLDRNEALNVLGRRAQSLAKELRDYLDELGV